MSAPNTGHAVAAPQRWKLLYAVGAAGLAACLIVMSENLRFKDFGDFVRAIGFMLEMQPDASGQQWPFRAVPLPINERFDLSNHVFGFMGWLQSLYSDHFDLRFSAIFAKLVLVLCADLLAREIGAMFPRPLLARALSFTALLLSMFYAHNAGMLKSFYGEYLFFLVLPLLLYGLLRIDRRSGAGAVLFAALVAGLSKVQYFCIPGVVLAALVLLRIGGHRAVPRWLLVGLALVQLVCIAPALHNPYAQLNRHQSTYWGSYLVLDAHELRALGLNERQLKCVGIDGWGHQAVGPGGSEPVNVGADKTCYGHQQLGMSDVLAPYFHYPSTLPRLLAYALPAHFHVQYFHVYKVMPYLGSVKDSFRSGRWLVRLSELRDKVVTPVWPVLLLAGLLQAAWSRTRRRAGLASATLVLTLFIASQIMVSLLGEGVRDLGKHLWGAQLALDFLVLALAAQLALLWTDRAPARQSGAPDSG